MHTTKHSTHLGGSGHVGVGCNSLHAGYRCCCHPPSTSSRCAEDGKKQKQAHHTHKTSPQKLKAWVAACACDPLPRPPTPVLAPVPNPLSKGTITHTLEECRTNSPARAQPREGNTVHGHVHAPSSPHHRARRATRLQYFKTTVVVIIVIGRVVVTARGGGSR